MDNTKKQPTGPLAAPIGRVTELPQTYLERNPITMSVLQRIDKDVPASAAVFVLCMNTSCKEYGIDTKARVAMFLAHLMVESQHLQRVTENLNYSVDGLLKTFGRHRISEADARKYGRTANQKANQKAIADLIYGGKWGMENLGNMQAGDGSKYIGRSLLQITGRWNYSEEGKRLGIDLVNKPELLEQPMYAVLSACNFWKRKGLNTFADKGDMKGSTKAINGGQSHLDQRIAYYQAGMKVLPA